MGRMRTERPNRLARLQPVIGSLIVTMGLSTAALVAQRGLDDRSLATAGMGAMMTLGGLGLIFRAPTSRAVGALFALAALLIAAAVFVLAQPR